jgi:hypothetical protein
LPVRFDSLREGAGDVVIEPAVVRVRGPREVLDRATFIRTQASDLSSRTASAPPSFAAVGRVPLVTELEGQAVRVTPTHVNVRVSTQPRKRYLLTDLPVSFLCPANFHLKPKFIDERAGKVTLEVTGPVRQEPPRVQAYVDLTRGKFISGLNHEPLQVQLPEEFALDKDREAPRVVAFELLPGDFNPGGLGMPESAPAVRER